MIALAYYWRLTAECVTAVSRVDGSNACVYWLWTVAAVPVPW
jgi:hypothetical protein